jgi:uncharacterized protein (DUF1330 family)
MKTVTITQDVLRDMVAALPADKPITNLNLLRFRDVAEYGAGSALPPCSGREAYFGRYAVGVMPIVTRLGAHVIWSGAAKSHLVCPDDERWDEVLIMEYPTPDALLTLFNDPEYQQLMIHRTAALEDSRLIALQPPETAI